MGVSIVSIFSIQPEIDHMLDHRSSSEEVLHSFVQARSCRTSWSYAKSALTPVARSKPRDPITIFDSVFSAGYKVSTSTLSSHRNKVIEVMPDHWFNAATAVKEKLLV